MKCPRCGAPLLKSYARGAVSDRTIDRTRVCRNGHRFLTVETISGELVRERDQHGKFQQSTKRRVA